MLNLYTNNVGRLNSIANISEPEKVTISLLNIKDALIKKIAQNQKPHMSRLNIAKSNFLQATIRYIDIAQANYHIEVLALCARSLYEIHLRMQYIKANTSRLKDWIIEMYKDEEDILEGMKLLTTEDSEEYKSLTRSQDALDKKIKSGALTLPKTFLNLSTATTSLGLENEYKALFKFFTKIVHPTSLSINSNYLTSTGSSHELQNPEIQNMLVAHIQLLSWAIHDLYDTIISTTPQTP